MTPLVSIIVPSYNQARYVGYTIQSLLSQTYPSIEIIVIDGMSTDRTKQVIEPHMGTIQWLSEPDSGQANAINKGLRRAKGDILAWLNSDDLYYPHTVETVVNYFDAHPSVYFVYGDAVAIDHRGRAYGKRTFVQATNYDELLNVRCRIIQPACFWRREIWETIGELDESLQYAMDYDYWIRVAKSYALAYIPVDLAKERLHSDAKTAHAALDRIQEIEFIVKAHARNEIPEYYDAEAAATYFVAGLASILRFHRNGFHLIMRSLQFKPPLGRFLFLVVMRSIVGKYGVWFWLYLSKFRRQ